MATPFIDDGYTDQETDAIRQTLIEQHMKPEADWHRRILPEITMLMSDVSEGQALLPSLTDALGFDIQGVALIA